MAYLEELPDQCPPATAQDQAFGPAYRILTASAASVEHFYSYRTLGLPKPGGVDDCRYMSCSMFTRADQATKIARLPKKRSICTHLATVVIQEGFGRSSINTNTSHVDFWPYDTFDVTAAVTEVVAL
ncbi:hypothetical protein D3C87_1694570 [compost metagenome]